MRSLAIALGCIALLSASAGDAAKAKKPPKGHLGSEWVGKDGDMRHPQLRLQLPSPWDPEPGLYRQPSFDWRASNLQSGPYPAGPLKADKEAEISLTLNIDENGKLAGCTIDSVDADPAFAAHACPHLLEHTRFHPALNDRGERIATLAKARLSYELRMRFYTVAPPDLMVAKRTQLNRELVLADFGITASTKKPADVDALSAAVRVDTMGKPVACNMTNPTFDDRIDARVCDILMKEVSYTPAQNHRGEAIVDVVTPYWRWE